MAYQNHKHHNRNHFGWWNPANEYQDYEATIEPAYPRPHHHKDHVSDRTNYEEPIAEVEAYSKAREPEFETTLHRYQRARLGDHNAFESVDQEADAFIQIEHRRMELAKSMRAA